MIFMIRIIIIFLIDDIMLFVLVCLNVDWICFLDICLFLIKKFINFFWLVRIKINEKNMIWVEIIFIGIL